MLALCIRSVRRPTNLSDDGERLRRLPAHLAPIEPHLVDLPPPRPARGTGVELHQGSPRADRADCRGRAALPGAEHPRGTDIGHPGPVPQGLEFGEGEVGRRAQLESSRRRWR